MTNKKQKTIKEITNILKKFEKYCNGLSPHNCEGPQFDLNCEYEAEIICAIVKENCKGGICK